MKNKKHSIIDKNMTMLVARIFIVALFAVSLFGKLTNFNGQAAYASSSWVPIPGELLIVAAIILELVGIITILLGWHMKVGCYALIVFTLAANFMFHNMFVDSAQTINFLKNLSIVGGLLILSMNKPGELAIKN